MNWSTRCGKTGGRSSNRRSGGSKGVARPYRRCCGDRRYDRLSCNRHSCRTGSEGVHWHRGASRRCINGFCRCSTKVHRTCCVIYNRHGSSHRSTRRRRSRLKGACSLGHATYCTGSYRANGACLQGIFKVPA